MKTTWVKGLGTAIIGLSLLTACAEESTMSSSEAEGKTTEENTEQTEQQEQQEKAEAAIEIKTEKFGAWKDSIDNVYGSYSAVITNTGDKPAMIGDIQINFEAEDGSILGTMPMVLAVPDIVMPGETAYIGENTGLESVKDAGEVAGVSTNIDFSSTDEEPIMLKTENVKLNEGKDEYSNAYSVTGTVINPNEEMADDIRLAAGLYDADGNFLATLTGSIMVSLNKDGKAGFELNYPELPKEVRGKAAEVKVKAYNWTF
ncbi:FxLYD domain-containing protein [Halobacillus salinus]|uniref:DUF4352 domain-containing protein n=1 Tax=Halobacillus salinus TaxID=192814 RepID=A0A4Z0GZ54_9BACI|nr:FxLYD domain-containing protein [Halobacillus salinus]TGB03493.1 hypothetical protein E4663_00350 [Halobacillus salinus]